MSKTILALGDVHLPWPHKQALKDLRRVIKSLKPHTIVQVGDLLDLYGLSRFSKDPGRGLTLDAEAVLGRDFIAEMQDSCEFYVQCEGNHEYRLRKTLQDSPSLASTHPSMRELLGMKPANWVPYHTHYYIGRVAFTHDLGHAGVHATKATLDAMQSNIVYGHTHRADIRYGGDVRGERHVAMNVGWLGDPIACDYLPEAKKKDWQTSVGVIDYAPGGAVHMQLLPFVGGKFLGV